MIFFSLHKSKYMGYAYYDRLVASLFLPTILENSKSGSQFLLNYTLTEIHEMLHILFKKLGVRGYTSEKTIEQTSQNLLRFIVDKQFAGDLAETFSDIVTGLELRYLFGLD